jgi:MarR family transcriptional regulator, organic hydroperoxide resistance regulator
MGAEPSSAVAPAQDVEADVERSGEALGQALKGAIAAARRLRGRETQRAGEVAHAQYALLFELAERGAMGAGELATAAELAGATVTVMLDHLEQAGLVVRERSERDRRVVVSRLTSAGQERVAARRERLAPLWNAAIGEFDADELRVATRVLDRVRAFFEQLDEADCGRHAVGEADRRRQDGGEADGRSRPPRGAAV